MNKKDAQEKLAKFLGSRILTFEVTNHDKGEWMAQCNEVYGLITAGKNSTREEMEDLIQDAIFTAAGIPAEFCDNNLLRNASLPSFLNENSQSRTQPVTLPDSKLVASYAISQPSLS